MRLRFDFLILSFLFSLSAPAVEILESFSSRDLFDASASTAVWNQALGKIHPSLQAVDYMPSATPIDFSVGDGSHGAFEPGTYAQFSVNGDISGNKIRLDQSRFPILKVTSFHLAAGWVLEPVGNLPLRIESLTTVRVEGEIWCHGGDGGDAAGATRGVGGTARCGGGNGGDGGSTSANGGNGTSITGTIVTGGQGGNFTGGAAVGGGGGGAWNGSNPPAHGPNHTASGGTKGVSQADPTFTTIAGGAGGGGGSGTAAHAGGGGGAGGGAVIIRAVGDVSIGTSPTSTTGYIYANGGNGGSSNASGGPGGGGGGGSVQILSGGTISIFNTDTVNETSQALNGTGGTNTDPLTGAIGGLGRTWLASQTYYLVAGSAGYTPIEESPVLGANNTVRFAPTAQSAITKAIDLQSTLANIESLTLSPTSADFQVEMRGSSDEFQSDDTGWTSQLSQVANKRFVKIKFTITTSTPFAPTMIDQASLQFTRGVKKDFDFKSTGCGLIAPNPKPPTGLMMLVFVGLLLLPAFVLARLRRRSV